MKKVFTLVLFLIALFCVSDTVKAEERIYLYLHDTYSNRVSKWDVTETTFGSVYYVPSFQRDGYKVSGYTYDKDGLYVIPEGLNEVYMFYGKQSGVLINSNMNGKITSDFHMYAVWSAINYDITYNLDGGINDLSNPQTYNTEQVVVLENPTKDGYRFIGWYMDEEQTKPITEIKQGTVGEITLYAKWECMHNITELQNYKEATCCEEGYSGDSFCAECKEKLRTGEILPATGMHNTIVIGEMEATCIKNGYSGEVYCTNSGKLVREGEVIAATGIHDIVVKDAKEATCTEEGYTGNEYCKVCESLIEEGSVVSATGIHDIIVKDAKEATCIEAGYTGNEYCKVCEKLIKVGITISMTDHLYDNGEVTLEPTEITTGIRTFTCEFCRGTKIEILPLIVKDCLHEKTVRKNRKESTCKDKGYSGDIYCKECAALIKEGEKLEPTNIHTWFLLSVKPATTDSFGEKKYCCTVCDVERTEILPKIESAKEENISINEEKNTPKEENDTKAELIVTAKNKKALIKKKTAVKGMKVRLQLKKLKGYKYQIKVSTSKKFNKNVDTYKTSKEKYTVKKLKKGKTYYVKVRTYKVIEGKTYYGKWSKTKMVKIKK